MLTGGHEQKWYVAMRQYIRDVVETPTHDIDVKKCSIKRFIARQ